MAPDKVLERVRAICLALPETSETNTWGHPNFRVANRIFCACEAYNGEWAACFKVGKAMQGVYLQDPRFFMTPYVGRHGWVSLKMTTKVNWQEVEDLVRTSYRLIAPAKIRKAHGL